jgi:hypothetical protein
MELSTWRILHHNVPAQPTVEWPVQQLREALPDDHPYRFVIHEPRQDLLEGSRQGGGRHGRVRVANASAGAKADSVCERFGGTLCRECLDYLISINERHLVFAILLMTLTLASMQFSSRITVSFSRDRVTQWTLGIFLGTFSYCMAALPTARSLPHPFAPVATVLGAMVLALVCVAC